MFRTILALALAASFIPSPLGAAGPPPAPARTKATAAPAADPFRTPEHIQHWIKHYRTSPNPQQLPAAVKAMSALGVFREIDTAGIYIGFVSGVIGANPAIADKLILEMFPIPPEDQVVIVRGIAWSGLPDWKGLMQRFVERMPAKRVLIDRYLYGRMPGLMELAVEEDPAGIDALWGHYYGSGGAPPVRRLISLLAWSSDDTDLDRLTAGNMVKLTLAVNATRDLELMTALKREAIHQGKTTAKPLAEVIEAAETYETAKIRKQALAAMSDVKQKGSSTKRNLSFWGQVGTTAIALGCVAAATLGQVEFGIPCVVGGATATAALKLLTLEK